MRQISLKRVFITNFLSFKKESVCFAESPGLKLLSGDNQLVKRLGANGAGKTSLIKAIQWCLFADQRVSQVLSWGEKLVEVLVELLINDSINSIYRCGPPMKLELNGKLAAQEEVDQLLGLTEERFKHAVMFGQGADLFPDLPIPERGRLLDDVLQLDVWQRASENASKKCTSLEKEVAEKKTDLAFIDGQLTQLPLEDSIQRQIIDWDEKHNLELLTLSNQMKDWEVDRTYNLDNLKKQSDGWKAQKLEELESKIQDITNAEKELALVEAQLEAMPETLDTSKLRTAVKTAEHKVISLTQEFTKLDTQRALIVKPRSFWLKHNNCPTCLQPITEYQKHEHLLIIDKEEQDLVNKLDEISNNLEIAKKDFESAKTALSFIEAQVVQQSEHKKNYRKEITQLQSVMKGAEVVAERIVKEVEEDKNPFSKQIEKLEKQKNPLTDQLQILKKKENPFAKTLEEVKKKREELDSKKRKETTSILKLEKAMVAVEYWKHGFKRIRLFFINKILTALQVEIKSAMSSLGLDNWSVELMTESLNKTGDSVKLGVQIKVGQPEKDKVDISTFSGGESQRLKLAAAMGLGSLIQRSSGVWFNFEVWDEPTSWLSAEGIEDLLEAFAYRADLLKKNVWVIDHRALQSSAFSEIWLVTKNSHGSKVTQVQ